jgi:ribosomal protein S18 acetylase RimI-like enzyme
MRSRPYAGPDDLRLTQDLVRERWRRLGTGAGWHVGDFAWWAAHDQRLVDHAAEGIHLWLDDSGEALASAWIDGHGTLDLEVLPSVDQGVLLPEALGWYRERVERLVPGERLKGRASVYAMEGDQYRIDLLVEAGYRPAGRGRDLVLSRPLADGGPPPVGLPPGFRVRPVRPDVELAARADVHRAAFHPSALTEAAYRRVVTTWPYRADLDWVAVAPGGELAAFCLCWLDQANRAVTLEPVGCRPEHRRDGLAGAVCAAAVRQAAGLGALTATVCGDPADAPAWALYHSLGFRPSVERIRFELPLVAGTGAPVSARP